MNRIWRIKNPNANLSLSLAKSINISPVTAQLLINRGIDNEMQAEHFLHGDLSSCHDPYLMKDMEKAVSRIREAIGRKEKVLVYGDYDVDGITAVTLLKKVFEYLGLDVAAYIPNRLEEGYGLNINAVKLAHRQRISLIITVDCGISAHKEVELANKNGIDIIVTDHHEIKTEELPKAFSILNPLQKGCPYPFKYLSGVGIAYKLAEALSKNTAYPIEDELDLVALGTVSDLSVQNGENRILTKCGLEKLNNTGKEGIKALIDVSGLKGKNISCSHVGYILGPRINAMGRVGSPDVALKLLLTNDKDEARTLADILNRENRNRQRIEKGVLDEAMEKIKKEINFKDSRVIVLSGANWHTGVIGIVASRIIDKFYRPTIIIALNGKTGKGSGRSIDNFHLFDAINACSEYLVDFGGHEAACGLVIEKNNIEKFTNAINRIAKDKILDEHLAPAIDIDMEVDLSDVTEQLLGEIDLLLPFGPENPRPVFFSRNTYLKNEPQRIARNGFKMWITNDKITCEAVNFRAEGMAIPSKGDRVSIVYSPTINAWQGVESLQLDLKDLRIGL